MKKIIALVLFAAMLFAFVPAASAAMDNSFTVYILGGDDAPWYAAQKPGYLLTDGGYIYAGENKTGITADVSAWNKAVAANQAVGKTETLTIELEGSYKDAEAHWYTANTNNVATNLWGKAVKIPYTVSNTTAGVTTEVVDVALIDGYKNYNYQLYNGDIYYYLDFVLTEDDSEQVHYISFSNNGGRVKLTIKWNNTDNDVAKAGKYVTMKVVGYDSTADQYGNYTVTYSDMYWDADEKEDIKGRLTFNIAAYTMSDRSKIVEDARDSYDTERSYLDGVSGGLLGSNAVVDFDYDDLKKYINSLDSLTGITVDEVIFNAAGTVAYYRSDYSSEQAWRTAAGYSGGLIWSTPVYEVVTISGTRYFLNRNQNTMDVRLKAFDTNGVAYPAGTVVSVGAVTRNTSSTAYTVQYKYTWGTESVYGWDRFLGKSSKYVNVAGEPTYVIDQQNCFVFTMGGIAQFAMAAGFYEDFNDNERSTRNAYTDEDIVLLFQNQYKYFQLIFTNGKVQEDVEFDIYYKNIARSKSGISVIGDREISIEVGNTVALPYVLDDAYAMSTTLKEDWKTADDKIVKITDKAKGEIKAVKVGTTYVYATDAAGNFQLFIVNVVDPTVVVEQPSTTAYKTYVVTASNLYVRSGPGTNYSKLGKVARGTEVYGVEIDGSVWVQVNYNGTTAYMSGKYLAEK